MEKGGKLNPFIPGSLVEGEDSVRTVELGDTIVVSGTKVVLNPTAYYSQFAGREVTIGKFPPYAAAQRFLARLKVSQTESDGTILQLSLQDNNLQRASDVLNTLVTKYNEDAIREKNRIAVNTAAFMAQVYGCGIDEVTDFTAQNAIRLFGL